jgi:signal transduction histidine kinase
MARIFRIVSALAIALLFSGNAFAAEFGTKEEAVALVKRAIAYVDQVGIDKAAPEFSDRKSGKWTDRDLYLTIANKDGIRVAHGLNQKLIGKSIAEASDVNGKPYGKEIMEVAASKGTGWVDYTFADPITKKLTPKTTYVERKGDLIFLSGVYKR